MGAKYLLERIVFSGMWTSERKPRGGMQAIGIREKGKILYRAWHPELTEEEQYKKAVWLASHWEVIREGVEIIMTRDGGLHWDHVRRDKISTFQQCLEELKTVDRRSRLEDIMMYSNEAWAEIVLEQTARIDRARRKMENFV